MPTETPTPRTDACKPEDLRALAQKLESEVSLLREMLEATIHERGELRYENNRLCETVKQMEGR